MAVNLALPINPQISGRDWLLLIGLSGLWGASFMFMGAALRELPVLTIVALRMGIAALALWVFVLVTKRSIPSDPKVWAALAGMGVVNNVIPFGLIVWGQQFIPAGLASILNAMTPIFTIIVSAIFLADERLTVRKAMGAIVGFSGVTVMFGLDNLAGMGNAILPQLAVLGATLSYGFATVYGRRFPRMGLDPFATAMGMATCSALMLIPAALIIEQPLAAMRVMSGFGWAAILGLALLSTALAHVIYFSILGRAGATNLSLVTFLIPPSAIFLGWLFLDERLGLAQFIGLGIIAMGLVVIDGRLWRRITGTNMP